MPCSGRSAGTAWMAAVVPMRAVLPRLGAGQSRWLFALDDTATQRYGPQVAGAGIHHNATPGPADQQFMYGHVWVTLSWVVRHALWGRLVCRCWPCCTCGKRMSRGSCRGTGEVSDQAPAGSGAGRMGGVAARLGKTLWVVADGAYAKRAVLAACPEGGRGGGEPVAPGRGLVEPAGAVLPGQRGQAAIYGTEAISLAKRAGHRHGWEHGDFVLYGKQVRKKYKTFLATYKPAGGLIRVVLVKDKPLGCLLLHRTGGVREFWTRWPTARPSSRTSTTSRKCTARASSNCATSGPTSPPTM